MRRFVVLRPALIVLLSFATSIAMGVACSSADGDAASFGTGGWPSFAGGAGGIGGGFVFDASSGGEHAGGRRIDPRCGSISNCNPGKIPDDPLACVGYEGEPTPPPRRDAGRQDDSFDAAGPSPDGGPADAGAGIAPDAAAPSVVPPVEAGADASSEAGAVDAQAPPSSVPETPSGTHGEPYACQVSADSNGNASHKCIQSGTGDDGAPCSSTSDCRAGFACVGETGAGECRPYCCDMDANTCGAPQDGSTGKTFCGERLLLEPGREPTLRVPVCIPAEACSLDELYPCTGSSCRCAADQTCTVVAGTTGCVTPGTGKVGEACPCAARFFCSSQNQCVKICKTAPGEGDCTPGKCQATAGFPDGWGVCVGLAPMNQ